jgi:hypothetical protein
VAFAVRPIESARQIFWRTAKAVFPVVLATISKRRMSSTSSRRAVTILASLLEANHVLLRRGTPVVKAAGRGGAGCVMSEGMF